MGNRAHVIFTDGDRISPAVYLHWNGGPESVYAFLAETERRGGLGHDTSYSAARFVGTVADFFGNDGLSLGILNGPKAITTKDLEPFDHGDNGVYVVDKGHVRRFVGAFGGGPLMEMAPDAVAKERVEAESSGAYVGIRDQIVRFDEAGDLVRLKG